MEYPKRFEPVQEPIRAATRVPGSEPVAMRVTTFHVRSETAAILKAISRGGASALAAILTWATAAYLRKVSRGDAVVLAVPAPGSRGRWVPLLCDVTLEAPAKASLVRVRDALEEVDANTPDLAETALGLGSSASLRDNGLCDTAVMLAADSEAKFASSDGAVFPASIALGLCFETSAQGLSAELHWREDCFDPRDVELIPGHLEALFGALASGMSLPLAGLSLLSPAEMLALVEQPNRTQVHATGPDTLYAAFALVAGALAQQTAVICGETELTYAALAARAERVAKALIAAGVAPGSRVGLMARRDDWLAPALLGILRAGCAYVPLDPEYPAERIRWILEDCQATALLASPGLSLPLGAPPTLRLGELSEPSERVTFPRVSSEDAAYFIYTSGSTGKPKGVRIDHGNVVNFFLGMDAVIPRAPGDTWLAITSISFDISVLELLWTLCRGMRVVVQETGKLVDADATASRRGAPAFSLFFFADCDEEQASARYDLLFRAAEFADREGMEAVWVPERHFHRFGGLFPNPSLAAAAVAARTRRIGIRAGSVVAPLHNPLRIAEEWSFVDNISGGRVGVSFASGWNPRDFVLAPEAFAERRQTLHRDIDFVRRFWRGEAMTLPGGNGSHEVRLYPRPVQRELPVWVTASDSIETFVKAGAAGANVLTHLLHHSLTALKDKIAAYRDAYREHHAGARAGTVTLMVHTFVGDSAEEVLEAVREPFLAYLRSSAELMRAALPPGLDASTLSAADKEAMVAAAFARFFEERGLFGTPQACLAKVQSLQDIGVDEIACLIDFVPDAALVYEHLRHLSALQSLARRSASELDVAGQIEAHKVTHFQCTPPLAKALLESSRFRESLRHLKVFAIGGEALARSLTDSIRQCSDVALFNMYGPTETTVWSTVQRVEAGADEIPLGRPIANTRVYVLAPDLSALPANRAGELCIGGSGVASGYWNRAELSAEKFVRDPFSSNPNARLYRTGDLARWEHDGALRFLGRLDRQVKLRGYRIELGEIEQRLLAEPGVREALVVSRHVAGSPKLCAYYRADVALEERALKAALSATLPAYMLPEFLIRVEAFPLTPNRKVDVRALPAPALGECTTSTPPLDAGAATLLAIWRRVLGKESLGPHDDFFRSGGDSIQAIQAAAQANAAGFAVSPKMIYEHVTAASLSRAISLRVASSSGSEALPSGELALLPAQRWFFGMQVPERNHWNQSLLLGLRPGVQAEPLRAAVEAAFARHPAFRLRFKKGAAGWTQSYAREPGASVAYRTAPNGADGVAAQSARPALEIEAGVAHRSLDIERGPLAAALHLRGLPEGDALLLSAHHLVVDGVSWRLLLEDITRAYRAIMGGDVATLPPAPALHAGEPRARDGVLAPESVAAAAFWSAKLSEVPEPVWKRAGSWRESECETWVNESARMSARDVSALRRWLKADAEALALAALVRAVRLCGLANALLIDMETHGRGSAADDGSSAAVGWMTRIYPLIVPAGPDDVARTLGQVKAALLECAPHKDHFDTDFAPAGAEPAQIIFNYLGRLDTPIQGSPLFSSLRLSPGAPRDPGAVRHHVLEVNVHQTEEALVWEFIHPVGLISRAALRRLGELCSQSLEELRALTPAASAECLLPQDFPGTALDQQEIRGLAARPAGLEDAFATTAQQRALYFQLEACTSDRSRGVHQALLAIEGCADPERLERALREVAAHHAAFRSSFLVSRSGVLVQVVSREANMPLRRLDWSELSAAERDARLRALRKLDLEQGILPREAPLARAVLVRSAREAYLLLWTYHHLIADGWSLPLVMRDVKDAYARGGAPQTPAGDFGLFARWLGSVDAREQEAFWAGYLREMRLPRPLSARGRKSDFSYRVEYGVLAQSVAEKATARWERFVRNEGATFAVMLQAAWGLALCRVSGAPESLFGITVAGRPAEVPGVEHAVGLFIHSVPFRFRPLPNDTPSALLRRIHAEGSALRENAYVEPAALGRLLGLKGGQIAFESVLVLVNFAGVEGRSASQEPAGLRLEALDLVERNPVPLTVAAVPGKRLSLEYMFDSRHFELAQVEELHRALLSALDDLASSPNSTIELLAETQTALAAGSH